MIFGWDISTSIVGVTVLDDDGEFKESSYYDMRKNTDMSLLDKVDEIEWWINETIKKHIDKENGSYLKHYVEERLGNFAAGKTMLQTLMKLAAFNLAVSYLIMKAANHEDGARGVGVTHIHPSTVKSIMKMDGLLIPKGSDKKLITLNFVVYKEPRFPVEYTKTGKPQPYCFDMADSYIVAKAGFKKAKSNWKSEER